MCRLGWVAIHHIPRVEAAVAGAQAGRQADCSALRQGSQGCGPVINSESCLAPAGPHCQLCAQGCRTKGGSGTLAAPLFPLNCCPRRALLDTHFSMSLFLQVFCMASCLLLSPLLVDGISVGKKEATYTLARLGSTGEGLGLSPTTTQRMSPFPNYS